MKKFGLIFILSAIISAAVMIGVQSFSTAAGTNSDVAFGVFVVVFILLFLLSKNTKFQNSSAVQAFKQGVAAGSTPKEKEFPLDEIGNYRVIEFGFPKVVTFRLAKRPRREQFRLKFVGLNKECRPVLYLITEFDELISADYSEIETNITWDNTKYDTFDDFAFSSFGTLNYRKWQKAKIEYQQHLEKSK